MKPLRSSHLALPLLLAACGGASPSAVNLSGGWGCPTATPECLRWSSSQPFLGSSSGTRHLAFTLHQDRGASAVTFAAQPTEGSGIAWTCPDGTFDGTHLALGACAVKVGSTCTTTITPSVTATGTTADGGAPAALAFASYQYTWGSAGCLGNGITVTVQPFELVLQE